LTARALFVAADGRAHPPWRLLLFLGLSAACVLVMFIALNPVWRALERLSGFDGTTEAYAATSGLLLAHWMTLRTFDVQPASFVWLDRNAARPSLMGYAALVGGAPIALMSLLLLAVGLLALLPSPDGPWLLVASQIAVVLLPAAFYEELLSRGYIFATLREWLGSVWAIGLTSVAFGLLHWWNPGATAMSLGLVTLAGIFLAVVLLVTQSLYAAWIAHFAWNFVMAALLHVPVSGLPLAKPDYQIVDSGPDWITGGTWGPEGGAAGAAGMLGALGFLYWRRTRRKHDNIER
jgi:membrane protease YdiL (CAAX protease family)